MRLEANRETTGTRRDGGNAIAAADSRGGATLAWVIRGLCARDSGYAFARADESALPLGLRGRAGGATTACGGHRPPLLETLAAVDWAPLRGLERNCGFLPALRADGFGLDALNTAVRGC